MINIKNSKLLLFDLDGTLLRSDKIISDSSIETLEKCRKTGLLIGVSTSRSQQNSLKYIAELAPEIIVSSGGALITYKNEPVYKVEFSVNEVNQIIRTAREICGADCEITVDTLDSHYWNYKIDPKAVDKQWEGTVYCDFSADFPEPSLKICVEIADDEIAHRLCSELKVYDSIRFTDGNWYKFTKKEATKENAIAKLCEILGISEKNVMAFGDDLADIGMLKMCGIGVAMGNAVDEVKEVSDIVIGTNDEDGIAVFLEENILR
jgi:Cof subfamily protein (haloacid dehalogenase superfamily)